MFKFFNKKDKVKYVCKKCKKTYTNKNDVKKVLGGSAYCCTKCCPPGHKKTKDKQVCEFC